MTTIRRATPADIDAIIAMGLQFQATTSYAHHLRATADTLRALATGVLQNGDAVIFLAERDAVIVGMLAATIYQQIMSGERIGMELCWWMDPSARGGRTALRLLRTAEAWAVTQGATVFQMMAPTKEVGAFYEALHYTPIETHYQRQVA